MADLYETNPTMIAYHCTILLKLLEDMISQEHPEIQLVLKIGGRGVAEETTRIACLVRSQRR